MAREFECERDGVVIRGREEDDLVANVERHLAQAHADLAGKVSREDILAAAEEAWGIRSRDEAVVADELVLCVRRTLPAARTAVYNALSDPRELAKWWGPRGFTAPSVEFDLCVGGSYRIAMQPPDGDPLFYLSGEFREVDPPARLAYTFRWDPPDPDDRQTLARLSLQDRGDRTELLLTQGEFSTMERLRLHEEGWADSLGRLEDVLRGAPANRSLCHSSRSDSECDTDAALAARREVQQHHTTTQEVSQ